MEETTSRETTQDVGCKCGAADYDNHVAKVESGYSAHVYNGPYGGAWSN